MVHMKQHNLTLQTKVTMLFSNYINIITREKDVRASLKDKKQEAKYMLDERKRYLLLQCTLYIRKYKDIQFRLTQIEISNFTQRDYEFKFL